MIDCSCYMELSTKIPKRQKKAWLKEKYWYGKKERKLQLNCRTVLQLNASPWLKVQQLCSLVSLQETNL